MKQARLPVASLSQRRSLSPGAIAMPRKLATFGTALLQAWRSLRYSANRALGRDFGYSAGTSMRRKGRPRAFTVVELIVVIAIIAMLAAFSYPVYQRTVEGGRAAACLSNLRQISVGLNAYLAENEMKMPTLQLARDSINDNVPVIDNTLDKYLTDKKVFACPADNKNLATKTGTSYCWNVALNGQPLSSLNFLQIQSDTTHIPVISDKEGFHPYLKDKVNILYADGHATKDVKFFTGN